MTQEIINYDGTLSKEEIESWKEIEEPGSCNSWTRNVPTASHMLFLTFLIFTLVIENIELAACFSACIQFLLAVTKIG